MTVYANATQAPVADPFTDPTVGFGGGGPAIREVEGRTVIFVPKRVDMSTQDKSGKSRPTIYTDVIVVDGGPLPYGSNEDKGTPATHVSQTPCRFDNVMYSNTNIVAALVDSIGKGIVVGSVYRSDVGKRPYNLATLEPLDPRRAAARDLWFAIQSGSFQNPTPQPLNGAQPAQYGQPAPQHSQPAYTPQTPVNPQYAAMASPVAQTVAARDINQPVPGFEALWPTFSEDQRRTIWASQPAGTPAPAPQAAPLPW